MGADPDTGIKSRLAAVQQRIAAAAAACGRDPASIRLVTVSKTMPVEKVREAIAAGAAVLGENYVQEARDKIAALSGLPASWHFIGHLQTNKAKYAVRLFEMIQTVDSFKLAQEIDRQAQKAGKIQNVLIQVNIGAERSKSGVAETDALELVQQLVPLHHITVSGLMTIPPYFDNPEKARPFFAALRQLRDRIAAADMSGIVMEHLSMGMTGDFETAIEEGATLVRIGTAVFGKRN